MKRYTSIILLLLPCLLFISLNKANGQVERLKNNLFAYVQEHPFTNLYVHLDKNFYMPGETLWFKAYLPSSSQLQSEALYVRIVNDKQDTVMKKEFLTYDVRAHGEITLPDTLEQGTYQLYAFTDKMVNFDPHDVFVQQFKVADNTGARFIGEASVIDTAVLKPGKKVNIIFGLKANGLPVKEGSVNYSIKNSTDQLVVKGKVNTTSLGKALISFEYPPIDPVQHLKLEATFTKGKLKTKLHLNLPPQHRQIVVNATAEGGKIQPSGWSMKMEGLEKQPSAVIYNQGMPGNAILVLRSTEDIVWHKAVSIKSGDSLAVPLPAVDSIKQVLSLALFDDSGKLYNERLFLTRKQDNYQVAFKLSKSSYGLQEKVKVNILVTDGNGRPVVSNLSVAAVAQKTLDETCYRTILDSLIAKNWWRHGWPEIMAYKPKGSLTLIANTGGVIGYVKPKKKRYKLDSLNDLFLFSSVPRPLDVKLNGGFSITAAELETDEDKENYIRVNDDFHYKYTLEIKDYIQDFDKRIIGSGLLVRPVEFLTATKPPEKPLFGQSIRLMEVKIKAGATGIDSLTYQKLLQVKPERCGDYVCAYHVINCQAHPTGGTRPVIGQRYTYNNNPDYIYKHCLTLPKGPDPNLFFLKTISRPREFPLADYQKNPVSTPEFLSTIYWSPNINTNKDGEASFEFYTSDLKGTYKIIVQGLEVNSLRGIYGKIDIVVQ